MSKTVESIHKLIINICCNDLFFNLQFNVMGKSSLYQNERYQNLSGNSTAMQTPSQ